MILGNMADLGNRLALDSARGHALAVWADTRHGTEVPRKPDLMSGVVLLDGGPGLAPGTRTALRAGEGGRLDPRVVVPPAVYRVVPRGTILLGMTTQIALKLPDALAAALDELVERGVYPNRSQAVRVAVEALVRRSAAERIDAAFAEGFTRHPERPEEIADATRLAVEAIEDEPWEPWW